ncbi:MAG TPA: cell division protein ZapA [bacterium]|nr:cell division protein ZapA [bacterium]
MSEEINILKVNIYGTEYPIKGSTDTEYIKKVAKYVDHKMREVDTGLTVDSSLKVAILAALNITDELFRERDRETNLPEYYHQTIQHLNQQLDDCLKKYSL